MEDFLQACPVSYSGLETCSLTHLTLSWCATCTWQGSVQLRGCFFGPVALSVCSVAAREVVVGFGVCWAFCLKGLLLSQTQGAQHTIVAFLPDTPRMVRWGCDGSLGLWWWLRFWQLGMGEISKLDFFPGLCLPAEIGLVSSFVGTS